MPTPDCAELLARAKELHAAATAHMERATALGMGDEGFTDEVVDAARCERLADAAEAKIAQDC